jgi:hypothetical protein
VLEIQGVIVNYLSAFIFLLCTFNVLASEIFQINDISNYPEYSEKAVEAVIDDLKKNNKELIDVYVLAKCDKKFCEIMSRTKKTSS